MSSLTHCVACDLCHPYSCPNCLREQNGWKHALIESTTYMGGSTLHAYMHGCIEEASSGGWGEVVTVGSRNMSADPRRPFPDPPRWLNLPSKGELCHCYVSLILNQAKTSWSLKYAMRLCKIWRRDWLDDIPKSNDMNQTCNFCSVNKDFNLKWS